MIGVRSHRGSRGSVTTPSGGAEAPSESHAVACRGLTKTYGGQVALQSLDWQCNRGQIHGLVGQNGAGKSTLVGSITGKILPDTGEVWVAGKRLPLGRPSASRRLGVAAVFQELGVVPALSVLENVFLGHTPNRSGMVDRREMLRRFTNLAARFEVSIDPNDPVGGLPVGKQQIIEIMRCVSCGATILLLDEPTAALSEAERASLHRMMAELRTQQLTVLFISHNLDEVEELCDEVTVLAEGQLVGTRPTASWDREELIAAIAGSAAEGTRAVEAKAGPTFDRANRASSASPRLLSRPALGTSRRDRNWSLTVHGLSLPGGTLALEEMTVRAGEIVGLAGLMGSGRTRLLRCLAGMEPSAVADVKVNGAAAPLPKTPYQALGLGVALVPEDRKNGLVLGRSIRDNMRLGAPSISKERPGASDTMQKALRRVGAPVARLSEPVGTLSGGNQQKVLMAKWLARGVKLLLVDEPTRGIDISSKSQILTLLRQLTGDGLAVVFVSSELEEVLAVADRVVVMAAGRSTADLERGDPRWTVHDILRIAFEGTGGANGAIVR